MHGSSTNTSNISREIEYIIQLYKKNNYWFPRKKKENKNIVLCNKLTPCSFFTCSFVV